MSQHDAILLLGSNLGNPEKNIELALDKIEAGGNNIIKITEFLKTSPIEFVSSNNFCNIAVLIKTQLSPTNLLNFLKGIELKMGRTKDSRAIGHYTDRLIDIDIVTYNRLRFWSKRLEIPHEKHYFSRDFSKYLIKKLIIG